MNWAAPPSGAPDAAEPAMAKMLGSVKKKIRVRKRKKEVAEGSQQRRAWRRMVVELVLVFGTKEKKHAIRAQL
jgi:hypothetical protein